MFYFCIFSNLPVALYLEESSIHFLRSQRNSINETLTTTKKVSVKFPQSEGDIIPSGPKTYLQRTP